MIVNSHENSTKFCTTEEGVLYLVDAQWYSDNTCDEKINEFKLKGQEWK